MARVKKLDASERTAGLPALAQQGWEAVEGRDAMRKILRFDDFGAAWGFMAQVALVAERLDHHPEWCNVWNKVDIVLTTHDAGGLSMLDLELAQSVDRCAAGARVVTGHGAALV